jgi:hypothetical protein
VRPRFRWEDTESQVKEVVRLWAVSKTVVNLRVP